MTDMSSPFGGGSNPLAPWHMWGSTVTWNLTAPQNPGIAGVKYATQIAKISYRRPDTWAFFFGGRILAHNTQGETKGVRLLFDVITGVGRTNFDTKAVESAGGSGEETAFCRLTWVIQPGTQLSQNNRKWTTQTYAPPLDEVLAVQPAPILIDRIVGQDIQCTATLFPDTFDAVGTNRLIVEATAMFAPLSHMRPDWFSEGVQFRGDEVGGT